MSLSALYILPKGAPFAREPAGDPVQGEGGGLVLVFFTSSGRWQEDSLGKHEKLGPRFNALGVVGLGDGLGEGLCPEAARSLWDVSKGADWRGHDFVEGGESLLHIHVVGAIDKHFWAFLLAATPSCVTFLSSAGRMDLSPCGHTTSAPPALLSVVGRHPITH